MPSVLKKILVMSDSHGYSVENILMKAESMGPIDAVFHAGDGCRDLDRYAGDLPMIYQVTATAFSRSPGTDLRPFGKGFLLCHGHHYSVKSTLSLLEDRAREVKADCRIRSHPPGVQQDTGTAPCSLNPGAACDRQFMLHYVYDDGSLYAKVFLNKVMHLCHLTE